MTRRATMGAFVAELEARDEVLAVILFGSVARGDARPDSDIDLIVIVRDGFARVVEVRDGQAFEIVQETESGAREFWDANPHDAAALWEVAQVLFDRDGTGERLRRHGESLRGRTPPRIYERNVRKCRLCAQRSPPWPAAD